MSNATFIVYVIGAIILLIGFVCFMEWLETRVKKRKQKSFRRILKLPPCSEQCDKREFELEYLKRQLHDTLRLEFNEKREDIGARMLNGSEEFRKYYNEYERLLMWYEGRQRLINDLTINNLK